MAASEAKNERRLGADFPGSAGGDLASDGAPTSSE
jgi:hypothetical protein